ncbi:MAG: hypothetical protein JNK82_42680 [Myxococcaceae bacterium]|nr:hypothetical protein [Myxococcaceae bacterium]
MTRTVLFSLLLATGCLSEPPVAVDGGTGGGRAGGSGGNSGRAGGGASCEPLTCATAGLTCGTGNDGCGGTLSCGACACTPSTFATDCPSKPCQAATGCIDNTCTYEPVTCNFERCDTCTGADGGACSDTDRRACGSGCVSSYCDPSPTMTEGRVVYANRCVARAEVRCGTCDLGSLVCVGDAGVTCQGVTFTGVNPQFIECNGGSPSATVLYVDPAFTGAAHTGAKDAPFLTLAEALSAAAVRTSRAIIIGGSPTLPGPLVMSNGVSIFGGFTGFPSWGRDDTRRPVVSTPVTALTAGQLVGLVARDIVTETELAGLDIETQAFTSVAQSGGASNIGAQVVNAPALVLRGVRVRVGNAQAGAAGANAAPAAGTVPTSAVGQNARSQNTSCPLASGITAALGGQAVAPTCTSGAPASNGLGGSGATVEKASATNPSFFTRGNAAPTGAQGGLAAFTMSMWVPGPGDPGAPWATPAVTGGAGTPSVEWVNDVPRALGRGGDGAPGQHGRGGGGGGGGNSSEALGNPIICRIGAGGGAGGAGGCGGNAGLGGWYGGWAIGLAVSGSSGLQLRDVTITVGNGGAGGTGGAGTDGLPGAVGGNGGTQSLGLPAFTGSRGGDGARGQRGGDGGGGATGLTRGVLCRAMQNLTTTNLVATGSGPSGFVAVDGCI